MYLNKRQQGILHYILINPATDAEQLAQFSGISTRTLSADIDLINHHLNKFHLQLENRRGSGYFCTHERQEDYSYLKTQVICRHFYTPVNETDFSERVGELIRTLLLSDGYLKTDELAEKLWRTRSSLNQELKEVSRRLSFYGLTLSKKPHYGISIIGSEIALRGCLVDYCRPLSHQIDPLPFLEDGYTRLGLSTKRVKEIYQAITKSFYAADFHMNEQAMEIITVHLLIMEKRIAQGHLVTISSSLCKIAEKCPIFGLAEPFLTSQIGFVSRQEQAYFTLLLCANIDFYHAGTLSEYHDFYRSALKMHEQLQSFFREKLNIVFNADARFSHILIGLLIQYEVRRSLGIWEQEYAGPAFLLASMLPASRQLACDSLAFLETLSGHKPDQYLLTNFTLLFYNTVMSIPSNRRRLRMLCIGPGALFASRSIDYKIRAQHHNYIDSIEYCEPYELAHIDLNRFDCIITTQPPEVLPIKANIPVMQLNYFMSWWDLYDFRNRIILPQISMETLFSEAVEVGFKKVLGPETPEDFIRFAASIVEINDSNYIEQLIHYNKLLPMMPDHSHVALFCNFSSLHECSKTKLFTFHNPVEWNGKKVRCAVICTIHLDFDTQILKSADSLLRRVLLDENEIISIPDEPEG
ncbi:helix-turn-helix domain-containing protein [Lachnospiraceae bacterium OttesenSCG-928-D06]|nr:helix-turn-helix domain-containing protein [Lachnospiraceae bacterium OttesenSCG-928-D06]